MNRLTRFLTALGLALLLAVAARAENPDGKGPGSRPCCKPCGECGRAGVGEGTATNDASYWNFLSGRLEQHVVLSTGHHGLALAELAIQYSNAYMPLSVARDFGDRWGLNLGGYVQNAADGSDALHYCAFDNQPVRFVPSGAGVYHSYPERAYSLKKSGDGGAPLSPTVAPLSTSP